MTTTQGISQAASHQLAKTDAQKAATGLAENFDSFLTLLTTQLQHQDPTKPMDTNQFTSQIVQFTSVQQAVKTNSNLEKLIALTEKEHYGVNQGTAVNYLDKYVTVNGSTRDYNGHRPIIWPVVVEGTGVAGSAIVKDRNGKIVFAEEVTFPNNSGKKGTTSTTSYTWHGNDAVNKKVKKGEYTLRMVAFDAKGKSVPISTDIAGTVTEVDFSNGEYIIRFKNGSSYNLRDLISVREDAPSQSKKKEQSNSNSQSNGNSTSGNNNNSSSGNSTSGNNNNSSSGNSTPEKKGKNS